LLGMLAYGWLASGCTSYRPHPLPEASLLAQATTQSDGALRIAVAVLDAEQNKAMFGVSLVQAGIQPVWLRCRRLASGTGI